MGSGAFGSNGSVHWEIRYSNASNAAPDHRDIDDSKRHPGDKSKAKKGLACIGGAADSAFRVTARYPSKEAAVDALQRALDRTQNAKRNTPVVLKVKLRPFKTSPGNPERWEVKINW